MQGAPLPLRELHLPGEVGWWPLAPGWWLLCVVVTAILVWAAWRGLQRWRHNAARRHALRLLDSYESEYLEHRDVVRLGKQVSELLRRGMLAYAPRAEVAGLTGEAWLEWLDRDLPVPYFHTEGGRSLLTLPYRNPASAARDVDVGALLAAARMRLTTPQRRDA